MNSAANMIFQVGRCLVNPLALAYAEGFFMGVRMNRRMKRRALAYFKVVLMGVFALSIVFIVLLAGWGASKLTHNATQQEIEEMLQR